MSSFVDTGQSIRRAVVSGFEIISFRDDNTAVCKLDFASSLLALVTNMRFVYGMPVSILVGIYPKGMT